MPLDVDALVQIMTEPKNALVKQYKRFFEMEQADLEFTPEALVEIAKKAKEKDTGARGLRSIVEEIMLDVMYELPDKAAKEKGKYVVTPEVVRKEKKLFDTPPTCRSPRPRSGRRRARDRVEAFERACRMDRDAFERALKAFPRRTPSHPFVVELVSGGQLQIDHPEALVFRNAIAVHFSREGIPTLFDHQSVARMIGTVDVSSAS